jgi:hypothetical protein
VRGQVHPITRQGEAQPRHSASRTRRASRRAEPSRIARSACPLVLSHAANLHDDTFPDHPLGRFDRERAPCSCSAVAIRCRRAPVVKRYHGTLPRSNRRFDPGRALWEIDERFVTARTVGHHSSQRAPEMSSFDGTGPGSGLRPGSGSGGIWNPRLALDDLPSRPSGTLS